jgi:hypothetical protein
MLKWIVFLVVEPDANIVESIWIQLAVHITEKNKINK